MGQQYALSGTGSPVAGSGTSGRRGRRWGWLAAVVALVLVLLGGGGTAAFAWYEHKSDNDKQHSSDAARDAACVFGRTVSTYDYNDLPAYRTAVTDASTGALKDQMQSTLPTLQSVITQSQARSHATDVQCFVKSADQDRAEVATIVSRSVTNSTTTDPRAQQVSLLLTMEFIDGRWLAAKMDQLAPPK